MIQSSPFETHVADYESWFESHYYVFETEMRAISQQLQQLPENIQGIEVGVGTGQYASRLGIAEGVEPAEAMREVAKSRGLDVMDAYAEHLPYKDMHFDFVLFVTICHLDSVLEAFKEAHRVLNHKGSIVVAFIDGHSPVAIKYGQKRKRSVFYRHARFYSVGYVLEQLEKAGFKDPVITQTLFQDIDELTTIEEPVAGYGEGSFIVIRASK